MKHGTRPEHKPEGDPCVRCGLSARRHRKRKRSGRYVSRNKSTIVAIDGEGSGRSPHRYTYLAAVDEHGVTRGELRAREGSELRTRDVLCFLLRLGADRVVGYSLSYDWTKILADLPGELLYRLARPETRVKGKGFHPVRWRGFRLNLLRGRLTVRQGKHRVTIWDVWRFFRGAFVQALADWNVGTVDERAQIAAMKQQRSAFEQLPRATVEAYCRTECALMAKLFRLVSDEHEAAELPLTHLFGAGSTAGAILRKLKVRDALTEPPSEMAHALLCGFHGGRHETARVGPVKGPVFTWDISAAYPYAMHDLPCLTHGRWEHVQDRSVGLRISAARLALVFARVGRSKAAFEPWGPLPWRAGDGKILYPRSNPGTWIWREEFLATEAWFARVEAREAWVYDSDCDCRPFEGMVDIYRDRCAAGAEGRGLVHKGGLNACWGKLAQGVGAAPYRSLAWAGATASRVRARLLPLLAQGGWHVLEVATDGISAEEPLRMTPPRYTGTESTGRPLGGWTQKIHADGVFVARPGVSFPLGGQELLGEVKARGISKRLLLEHASRIVEHYQRHGPAVPYGIRAERFISMLLGTTAIGRAPNYGEWVPQKLPVSFSPGPKRMRIEADRLVTWPEPPVAAPSSPYVRRGRAEKMIVR
jgi:hypothetical protein